MYAYVQVKTFFLTTGYLKKSTSTCDNNLYVKMGVNDGGLFTPLGGFFLHLETFSPYGGHFFYTMASFYLWDPFHKGWGEFCLHMGTFFTMHVYPPYWGGL